MEAKLTVGVVPTVGGLHPWTYVSEPLLEPVGREPVWPSGKALGW